MTTQYFWTIPFRSYIDPEESFRRTLKLSLLLRCPTSGSKDNVIFCLTRKSAEDISRLESEVLGGQSRKKFPGSTFVPTSDPKSIPASPKKMLQRMSLTSRDLSVLVSFSKTNSFQKSPMKLDRFINDNIYI